MTALVAGPGQPADLRRAMTHRVGERRGARADSKRTHHRVGDGVMTGSSAWRNSVFHKTRLQMMAVLAVGGLLGYLAASGGLNPFQRAAAAPTAAADTTPAPAPGQAACC